LESSHNHHSFIPSNPNADGYDYQWWIYPRSGAYAARGYLGQYIWVIPSHDLVVIITGNSNAIEDHWLIERHILLATTPAPPPFNPTLIFLPIGVGVCIAVIAGLMYWKRRPH